MTNFKPFAILLLLSFLIFGNAPASAQMTCSINDLKDLDFWLGDWDFHSTSGKWLGKTSVRLVGGTCTLEENWEGKDGFKSQGLINFDPLSNQWTQLWKDEFGNELHFQGNFQNNQLDLKATSQNHKGEKTYHRLVYIKKQNGTVGQFWKISTDKKNWKTIFSGTYSRKAPCL